MTEIRRTDDISVIKGIGNKKRERLNAIGIERVSDLIEHFPVRYRDKRTVVPSNRLKENRDNLASGTLISWHTHRIGARRTVIECIMRDKYGVFHAAFFNMSYLEATLKTGEEYVAFGRMKRRNGISVFTNPEICPVGDEKDKRGLIPVYRCTAGVTSNDFARWIRFAVDNTADIRTEWLNKKLVTENRLCDEYYAYSNIHFPADEHKFNIARYRLIYQKLLTYLLAVKINRNRISDPSLDATVKKTDMKPFMKELPFVYTEGQLDAVRDIENDMVSARPMNRLIQGDVGCGKTAVAEAAIYMAVYDGGQCAFMAPTEILAKQHFEKVSELFERFGFTAGLLTSGMKSSDRKNLVERIKKGDIDIVVGTHALISDDVEFKNLKLIITDEQHRFGVNQRKALTEKAKAASNVLVMSATPIPRTLATTVFGDMDFSIIRAKPANRKKIVTQALTPSEREKAYTAVREQISKGYQAYIVAPSIEEDESELTSAEALYEEVRKEFCGMKVELIHGRMNAERKAEIMSDFAAKKIDILVSTVVIEVGIDVPGATVIVIENAERFGLAQMHQLRGRVGRSDAQSYCFLINYSRSENAADRMKAMTEMSDGFEISEEDYRLRGPGDIRGTAQHGDSSEVFDLFRYTKILEAAGRDADALLGDESFGIDMEVLSQRISRLYTADNSKII